MTLHRLGRRGEAWVAAQLILFVLFGLAPHVGPAWPMPIAFQGVGAVFTLAGLAVLGHSALKLGSSLTPFPKPLPTAKLVTTGVYRLVRHPIYSGILLVAAGIALFTMSPLRMLLVLMLALFFDRKANREEAWLIERYSGYREYRALTKKFIPWVY